MDCSLPTPTAGRTVTSKVTSSGSSSRLETSIGPLTEPTIVYPRAVCVAEPSGFRSVFIADEAVDADIFEICNGLYALTQHQYTSR
jgi:hypothetical protein